MGAPDLLHHLRNAGLVLSLSRDGGLYVTPRQALTDEHRAAIRGERDALVLALRAETQSSRRSGNALMTPEQGDDCHAGGWDGPEISAFTARAARSVQMGQADADDLAERLTLRDREGDDRRMCVECSHLGRRGRCIAAADGRLPGADPRLEPVPTILQRCDAFRSNEPEKEYQ